MSVKRLPDGTLEFSTVAEAVQYDLELQKMQAAANGGGRAEIAAAPRTEALAQFFRAMSNGNMKSILGAILSQEGSVKTEQIATAAGLETSQIGPVMRHIVAYMQKNNIKPAAVIKKVKIRDSENKLVTEYTAKDRARQAWRQAQQPQ